MIGMNDHEHEDGALPPRSKLHSSYRGKWNKRFQGLLVLLFAALIVVLIAWHQLYTL